MHSGDNKMTGTTAPWLRPHAEWNLHIMDCVLPDLAAAQGKSIAALDLRAKFGCSVVGIERQGFMIPVPPPTEVLYPRDRVLLMGTTDQVRQGRAFLGQVSGGTAADSIFEEVQMQVLRIDADSRAAGRTLGELAPAQTFGVQIAGVNRHGVRILNPAANETLCAGDEVLALGAPAQIRDFKAWVTERAEEEPGAEAHAVK
jgi:CPA2 family monovalent cation:H+ antiporter-2